MPERVRVQREGAQLQAQGTWSAGGADDKARFLADLRALRGTAALEFDEFAARAHYPSDVLKEAENGPALPGLPILAAYVRACDGDVPEWEERWRRLGLESRADPSLPVRPAGASPAAVAGARAGVGVAPPDAYDPERIRAALRGSHGRSDQGARGIASRAPRRVEPDTAGPAAAEPRVPDSPAAWSTGTSWDQAARWDAGAQPGTSKGRDAGAAPGTGTSWDGFQRNPRWDGAAADLSGTPANGNHHVIKPDGGSPDTGVIPAPDAARADALRHDPFSADWLQDSELTSTPDPEPGPPEPAGAGTSPAGPDGWFTPRETAGPEQTRPPAEIGPSAATTDNWFTPRDRPEPQPTEREAPPHERSVQRPGPQPGSPAAQEHAIAPASWPASAEPQVSGTPGTGDRTAPVLAQAGAATPSRTIAGPAVPPGPVVPPSQPRPDRLYPVRLLVVIVVAALIGSILVLLLR